MTRWRRGRATALLTAAGLVALVATAGPARPDATDGSSLVPVAEWRIFPRDTVEQGAVVPDEVAGVGYAFSGTKPGEWSRVQAVRLATGKLLGKPLAIPVISPAAPMVIDAARHTIVVAESYSNGSSFGATGNLLGIAYRGGTLVQAFHVTSPLGYLRIAGFATVDDDVLVVGTSDGVGQNIVAGTGIVEVQRVSLADLAAGRATTRWTQPLQLPDGACPTLIQTSQPAGVLALGDRIYLGCRGVTAAGTGGFVPQGALNGAAGVAEVSGANPKVASPSTTTRVFRSAGNFQNFGETVADPRTHRMLLVESSGYLGMRAFDADHHRYVGRIAAGQAGLAGAVVDEHRGRVYFASYDSNVGIGFSDIAPVVPTQGERLTDPYAAWLHRGGTRRLTFAPEARRLYVPLERLDNDGTSVQTILVMRDTSDPYRPAGAPDYGAGAIDAVDKEGVTDSAIAASAQAFGADYQVIGGTANLVQNITGSDTRGVARPGSRWLRTAYVKSANLTGDGAIAYATIAEEDATTDADRHSVSAGDTFAKIAGCSDYGAGPDKHTEAGALAECDLAHDSAHGSATYRHDDGVLVTSPAATTAPYPAPVQVGAAHADIAETRPGRGALTTVVTASADNVSILDVVRFGHVSQTITVSAHGRTGTAKVDRVVRVDEVEVNGARLCATSCPLDLVKDRVNAALDGRAYVEFPTGAVTKPTRGTYAEYTQDAWYHAERVLDYDKATDDRIVPLMTVETRLDGTSKSRLLVELAGVNGTAGYRVFPAGHDDFGGDGNTGGGTDDGGSITVPRVIESTAPTTGVPQPRASASAPPSVASGGDGVVSALIDRVRLSVRSVGEALPLLMIWALLGVPSYLAARRRLLLELPMLTRDEDVT